MEATILGIIPARGCSKGLPGKNIRLLGDRPLIAHTIEAAKKSRSLTDVIVSTDDTAISRVSEQYGAKVPYLRPEHLANDTASSIDVVLYHLDYLERKGEKLPEYICLLQCTTPFRGSDAIEGAVAKCLEVSAPACVSVVEAPTHPYWMVTMNEQQEMVYATEREEAVTRRQDLPPVYTFNGGIYLIKTEVLRAERTFVPQGTVAYVMDEVHSVDIDTLLDFKYCEMLYNEGLV